MKFSSALLLPSDNYYLSLKIQSNIGASVLVTHSTANENPRCKCEKMSTLTVLSSHLMYGICQAKLRHYIICEVTLRIIITCQLARRTHVICKAALRTNIYLVK